MLTIIPARSVWVKTLLTFIFLLVFFVPKTIFGVESEIITTSSQFNAGEHSNTESKSEEGKVKLTGDGSWSARLWGTPPLTLSEGTTLTSDGTYTYMFIGRDYRLMKYLPEENRWKELAHAPRMAYSGSDMIVLGDFIYVSFGGYQKEFAKYSISKNTWTELNDLPDLINSGSGLTTDGTYVYASRGAGTDELWRYDPTAGTWSSLSSFPATISTGSDLVFDDSTGTDYIFAPRGGNTTTFYRYTIATNTWTTMAVVPGNLNDNGNMTIRNGVIYKLQGSGFDVFYKYTIATDTWSTLPVAPSVTRSVGVTYNPTEDLLYVFRGNGSYDWWKYDADDNTFLGPKDLPNTPGSGADIIYASTDTIYFRRGNNNTAFYKYTISTDTWTTLASAPDTFNDDNKGVKAGNALYFLRGGNTTTFYRYNIASDTWDTLAVTPANSQYGASLAYPGSGDYIYATRGALTTVFWRYSISGNSWDDASAADLPTGAYAGYGSRIVSDGTDIYAVTGTGLNDMYKYTIGTNTWSYLNASPLSPYWGTDMVYYNGKIYAQSGYYKTDFWEYTIASNTWHRLPYMASFYAFDLGPYNGGSLAADTDNGVLYSINGQNIYRMQSYNVTSYKYPANGTWTSDTIDLSYIASWDSISVDTTTPSDSTVTVQTRTSSDAITWSSWEAISGTDIQSDALRYVQVRAILTASTGRVDTPAVNAITITYNGDTTAPTNPTLSSASSQDVGGSAITSGQSYRHANPYFVWSGASDTESSVSGYYVYYGTNASADPANDGTFQTASSYVVTTPMSTNSYYLIIKTKDTAGNISASSTLFTYVYAGVSPPDSVSQTSTADFSTGTTSNTSTANDSITLSNKAGFWQQSRLSLAPGGVGYGAGFAYVSSSNKLYTFRGQNTTDFYEYDIASDTWTAKASAPAVVYRGGDLIEGPSGYLYGLRGETTTTFWRYDIAGDTWSDGAAADPPSTIYYGSSLIFDGEQYVYALRGNNDDAFYRYDTLSNAWESMANVDFGAPVTQINNNVNLGADLAFDGADTIYVSQGNTYTGFSSYSISGDSWSSLPNLPVKAYDGSQIEYDADSNAIYYMSGWSNPFFYKYSIATQTWSKLQDTPITVHYGGSMRNVDGTLHILRGASSTTFWKYNITKATWHIPTIGLFGNEFRGTDYRSFGYGAQITKGDGNYFYLVRGNTDNIFVRYDASSGEAVRMADAPAGFYIGSAMRYDSTANKIYATPSLYIRKFFVYDIATNTWSEETSDPVPVYPSSGSSLTYDGSRYMYWSRGGSASFYRYDTQGTTGAKWTQMANITGSFGYGGSLVYKNGYIYGLRGNNTNAFYRYDVAGNTWSDVAVADLASGKNVYNDGFLVSSGDNSFIACRGANNAECFEYSISGDTWSAIANAPANIYVGGSAATNGTDRIYVIAGGSGTNTYNNGLYTYILSTSTSSFEDSGTFTSGTMDMGSAYKYAHIAVNYTSADNTSLTVYTRTSTDDATYTSWSEATELKTSGSTYTYKINSPTRQYIQVKFELSSADGVYSGRINDFEIGYYEDSVEPTNPTTLSSYATNALATSITTNTWYNYASPYFYWPGEDEVGGATDTSTGSGILGYYVYFGTDANAVPETDGTFTTNTYHQASSLASGSTYYLRIQAVDNASNAQSTVWQPYIYKYDSTLPTNPNTLVANPPGYSATDSFTFSWSGASDADSGVAQYCYKTGAVGSTDTCISESSIASVASYKTGSNTFYVRTKDTAGNYSSDYVTVSYYFSSTAPGAPQNVQVSPTSNTTNAFAFTWEPPTLYYGSQAGLRYYYSVNAFPSSSNVNSVGLEVTYLSEGSYATQNGSNVFYVVAKDEAGNIDYNNYGSVSFIADTSAPGIPQNIEIADISVKETSSWKLAVSWEPPTELGSGLSIYKVYSSTVENASCTGNFADFSYLSSTTGKSFVDTDLEQEIHYYCSKACSSTNDCSAPSDTVSLYPDGKWKVAPSLVAEPFVTVKTKTANITWSTSRKSTSFVKYGTSSGSYGEEVGSSEAVSAHEIDVIGLEPGTTYYYQVLWTDEDGNTGKSDEYTFTTNEAPYVSAVSVSNISLYEAYVTFTLKNATKATVQHGKSLTYGGSVEVSTSKSESTYTVKIDDLTDGTEYHIRIAAEDEESNIYYSDDYIFETLPVPKISNLVIQQVEGFPTATFRLLWQSNTRLSSIVTYYPTNNPSAARDYINLSPKISHEAVLTDLLDETEYTLIIKGKDAVGNEAKFANQSVKTSADLRPPEIINDNIESTVTGVGDEARAQIIISWDTDEPSTSQVEYGVGTSGEYALSTQEDTNLTSNHSLSIPGLDPAKIYHIRIKSKDKNGNIGYSSDIVVITPKATENALNLVVNKLSKTFGFLKNTSVVP